MSILPISNIVNVSIATNQVGVNAYNTSNLALFTTEAPDLGTFGSLGYARYLSPDQVATDFGSSALTYKMANSVFSQQPNILNGDGEFIAILMMEEDQDLDFNHIPASGAFTIQSVNGITASIAWNDSAATIQTKLRAVAGQEKWVVTGSLASQNITINMYGTYGPVALVTTPTNTLASSAPAAITITVSEDQAGESFADAITRTTSLVQYFGVMAIHDADVMDQVDVLAAAAVIQPLNKIAFFVSNQAADILPGGLLDLLTSASYSQSRGLYYGLTTVADGHLLEMAGYAGGALSTNFSGSNTTSTRNLKTIVGTLADTTLTQTQLGQAMDAGVDTYPSLQGYPGIISSGANQYFDQIYGTRWCSGALQVAGFNYLAQSNTKIPQTQDGMNGLVGAYRQICQLAVINGWAAPGTWTSPTTFGNQQMFYQNIEQYGFYIWAQPIGQQLQVDRVARKAPLVSIAIKLAGAIHSSDVIVYLNA